MIFDNKKTVTLDLNGHSVGQDYTFGVGGTSLDDSNRTGKLIIKGKGDIKAGVTVWSSGVLDLSGWTGTEMYYIGVYGGSTVTGIPDNAHIENMSLSAWQSNDRCVVLNGGSFDSIFWSNESGEPEIMIGYLLEDGYAFQQKDGQFVSYTKILNLSDSSVFNVKVVKCTEHADSDGDGKCDYCNGQIVARVDVKNGGSHIYTDFQDAVDSIAASGIHTVTLLADATGSYTVTQGRGTTIKLNGKTVNEITVSGESNMAFNDSGTVNSVIFSGNAAKFNAGNQLFTISAVTVKDGATWSSILPNAELHGYQVYNSDESSYKWYDAGMLEEFLGDKNTINNVKVQQLPVTKDPILMIDGQKIAEQSSISVYKTFVFSFESYVTNGTGGSGVLFIQKDGDSTIDTVEADGDWKIFTCPERTFDISKRGTYKVWTEVSKQGYTRRSKIYTLNVSADLKDAQVTLKQSEFTYTPETSAGATEFTAEIDSVKLFGHDVPADAYTISGNKGTDARTYTITITAKDGGDYIGFQTVNWTIKPRVLTEVEACRYVKKYDGTKEITADNIGRNDSPPHFYYSGCPAGGIMLKYGEDYNITNVKANFSKPDAEEYADVSFNVELTNSNYIFKDEYDNEMTSRTVTQGMYIGKANVLPTGCEPDSDELIVRNGAAHTYTYDVSKLLKELPNGLNYGTTSYELENIGSVDNGYIDNGTVSITQNGILTVPVKKVNTEASEEIAIVKVKVIAQNYAEFTVTVTVRAKNKLVPIGNPTLSDNAAITYGEKISKISMSGKLHDDTNNVDVEGEFTWNAPDTTPDAGDYEAEWTFTPTGDNAYMYAAATGKATIKVNKAPLVEGADYEKPTAITDLVYKVSDDTPQALHTNGRVIGTVGAMKYTLGDPESVDTVWSEEPVASRNAGEFTVYYKIFGDDNHLDSAYGEIKCSIAKYELTYSVVCLPKVYDGTTVGDPKRVDNVKFYSNDISSKEITGFVNGTDYTVDKIEYKSANVGGNLGTLPVDATATLSLIGDAAVNYKLADNGKASGLITPAPFTGINFNSYTYEICYGETTPRSVTLTYFGAPDKLNYEIYSDMVVSSNDILSKIELVDDSYFNFAVKEGLKGDAIGKSVTVKFNIYSKDHNYCSEELTFTVKLIDKATPDLTVKEIKTVYNNKPVSASLIDGKATIKGHEIEGTWSWENDESPTDVSESREYTAKFEPKYSHLYYGATEKVKVTVTPRDIGDKDIFLPSGDSFVYTGKFTIPYIYGEYKYDENKEALGLIEDKDYTLTYPEDAINVGKKTITVTGYGNFGGTTELEYEITPCTQTPLIDLELPENGYVYDGTDKTPSVTVKVNGTVLTEGKDYELAYSNNKDAEDGAKVTVTAKGNYGFEPIVRYFGIAKADSVIDTEPAANSFTYDALSHKLLIEGEVTGGTFEYKLGDGDWVRDIPKAKDAGEYTVWYKVAGDSNHNDIGEKSVKVTIERKDIADADIVLGPSLTYNAKEQVQTVFHVKFERFNATYDVENNRATNAGTYNLKVIGTGNFKGEREVEFTIAKKEVKAASVTVGGEYTYNGKDIEPTDITVKDGEDIIPDTEYTVSFENNRNAGTAKVTITNAEGGNYIVSGTGEFEIKQANITVNPKNISKVYGAEPEFKLESGSELITDEELAAFASTAKFYSKGAEKTAEVIDGGYEITVELTENETDNLILTVSGTGILTVMPKKLTIKVNNVNREYGAENPELTVSYDGFVNGEDESALGGELKLSYDNIDKTTAVGTYTGAAKAEGQTSGNYEITYVYGDVEIVKIPVNVSAQTATETYLTIELDRAVEGLGQANFEIKDSDGNSVSLTNVIAAPGNQIYTLRGRFTAGREYTVKITLSGIAADETHRLVNDELVITPVRTNSGGSGSATTYYTVSFETNGAGKISSRNVSKNSVIKEPAAPEKEGYDFAGWYTDKELKEKYDFSSKVTKSFTLYAAWTKKDDLQNQIILTIGKKEAQVFGEIKTNDVAPQIVNDRTMLPARFVAENLGADVSWDGEKQLVTIKGKHLKTGEDVVILITIGEQSALVNGKEVKLDSPAFVENDRTYTPIRFISEQLGADVEWIAEKQQVVITK